MRKYVINKLRLTVDFGKRNLHDGQGEWGAMAQDSVNRWAFPLFPTSGGYTKSAERFPKMRNFYLEVPAARDDVGNGSDVKKATTTKQDRKGSK